MTDETRQTRDEIFNSLNFAINTNTYAVLLPEQAKLIMMILTGSYASYDPDGNLDLDHLFDYAHLMERLVKVILTHDKKDERSQDEMPVRLISLLDAAIQVEETMPEKRIACLTCKFWHNTGKPVPFSSCRRMVIDQNDQLTLVENAVNLNDVFYLNTRADYLCKYYQRKERLPKKLFTFDFDGKTPAWFNPQNLMGTEN